MKSHYRSGPKVHTRSSEVFVADEDEDSDLEDRWSVGFWR